MQVSILVILLAVGYLTLKVGILDLASTRRLSGFLINITIPALILSSMQVPFSTDRLTQTYEMLALTAGLYFLSFIIGWLLSRVLTGSTGDRGVIQFAIVFGNVVFMGFPIVGAIFGSDALFFVAIANIFFYTLIFSLGVVMMTGGRMEGFNPKVLVNPGIIATIIGFILFLWSVQIPTPFIESITLLGSVTSPLAMIIGGALLATFPAREMAGDWRTGVISLVKIVAIPVVIWLVLRPFVIDPLLLGVLITLAAMPVGTNTSIFAEEYGANSRLASQLVFVSTIASLVTIPLIVTLLAV
ncbi:MAG: AEC family transporter [Methanomicrobiales archaeon]|nr:AEC family transporter [Methanomicrobiales archaeon]